MGTNKPQALVLQNQQIFNFDSSTPIEVVLINKQPYFVATDVCKALRLSNISEAIKPIDNDEKLTSEILRSGQRRTVWLVSESGLYALIMRCHDAIRPGTMPHRFRKWVTSEVLPAIRRTGKYDAKPNDGEDYRRTAEVWKGKYERLAASSELHCQAYDVLRGCYELMRKERDRLQAFRDNFMELALKS